MISKVDSVAMPVYKPCLSKDKKVKKNALQFFGRQVVDCLHAIMRNCGPEFTAIVKTNFALHDTLKEIQAANIACESDIRALKDSTSMTEKVETKYEIFILKSKHQVEEEEETITQEYFSKFKEWKKSGKGKKSPELKFEDSEEFVLMQSELTQMKRKVERYWEKQYIQDHEEYCRYVCSPSSGEARRCMR